MSQYDHYLNPQSGYSGPAETIRVEDEPEHCQAAIRNAKGDRTVICEVCGNRFDPNLSGQWRKNL